MVSEKMIYQIVNDEDDEEDDDEDGRRIIPLALGLSAGGLKTGVQNNLKRYIFLFYICVINNLYMQ